MYNRLPPVFMNLSVHINPPRASEATVQQVAQLVADLGESECLRTRRNVRVVDGANVLPVTKTRKAAPRTPPDRAPCGCPRNKCSTISHGLGGLCQERPATSSYFTAVTETAARRSKTSKYSQKSQATNNAANANGNLELRELYSP